MNQKFFNQLQLPKKLKILDLGCNDGKKNKWMRKDHRYRGVDLLYEDSHIKKEDLVSWLASNKKRFDLILAEFSLQFVPKKSLWQTVKNIKKALKLGGYFFLCAFSEIDKINPSFSQKEYLKIVYGLRIVSWNLKKDFDYKKRSREVTEILSKKG